MSAPPTEQMTTDPCEKCGSPVFGYVEDWCCDGRECACMGRPMTPCWCDKCWAAYTAEAEARTNQFTKNFSI